MSNKLPILTELPQITSKIKIDTELISKKSAQMQQKRTDEHKSNESIQMGDSIPVRTTNSKSSTGIVVVTNYEVNYTGILIGMFFIIVLGVGIYYLYTSNKKKLSEHSSAIRRSPT